MASLRSGQNSDPDGYDVAQVCRSGHMINSSAIDYPEFSKDFCSECGQPTLTDCEHCHTPIRGHLRGVMSVREPPTPNFCHGCGRPYPWTETALNAARELADALSVTDAEKQLLKADLEDLVKDTPRTPLAAFRFKQIVAKAGPQVGGMFKEILIGVISNAAQKGMGLG